MLTASPYLDRLDWTLPEFTRVAWTSDEAREVWAPRLERLSELAREVEWHAVAAGVRACAWKLLSAEDFARDAPMWADCGLAARPLQKVAASSAYSNRARPPASGERFAVRVVIGRPEDVDRFAGAWTSDDHDQVGALLGYPPCCRRFFTKYWIEHRCLDTTWPMALASAGEPAGTTIEVAADRPATNVLWRWVGVRAVPHLPCGFACAATVRFAEALRKISESLGFLDELGWQDEILSWPVEWSALHGIAEVKNPILKISTQTDATAGKHVVRWLGTRYPKEGAKGLGFPYRHDRPVITTSSAFRRGLDNPLAGAAKSPQEP